MSASALPLWALGDCHLNVGRFLDVADLAVSEQAQAFNPEAAASLWDEAALRSIASAPLWGHKAQGVLQQLSEENVRGKALLCELRLLRKAIFPPRAWAPGGVMETSFCSLKAMPRMEALRLPEAQGQESQESSNNNHSNHNNDDNNNDNDSDSWHWEDPVPALAAVPLSIGAFRGHSLAVAVQVESHGAIRDGFCIGVEICSPPAEGLLMSVMFAPASGQCWMQYAQGVPMMRTQALPPVDASEPVEAWVKVTADGGIFFLRQRQGHPLEESGLLPHDSLPSWAAEYFATLYLWTSDLEVPVAASVIYSGEDLPKKLLSAGAPHFEITGAWHLEGDVEEDDAHYALLDNGWY
ncbi:unnamed protein product [Polarella glacialis]|uniref:Uncharacterized protein n=1 Tax=Polarella glacialis TaxID=89957 RepID=A0A813GT81_POLGL|nr:unnamed protein product [Polarella glacialis]CAE8723586.1 unnamed protein product [Polarella glacialis]